MFQKDILDIYMNKNGSLNVLQVITSITYGGAERVVFNLCKNKYSKDFNYIVLSLKKGDSFIKSFDDENINTKVLCLSNNPFKLLLFLISVKKFIENKNIKIVHCHLYHSYLFILLLKLFVPKIVIIFTPHSHFLGSSFRHLLVRYTKYLRHIDIIFSKSMLRKMHVHNYRVIYNSVQLPINFKQFDNLKFSKQNPIKLISVGRLEPVKNHLFLLKTLLDMPEYFYFTLDIVGAGSLYHKIYSYIEFNNLQDRVKLLGQSDTVSDYLNASDCFVLTSVWEGMPLVLLEAGFASLPILSTPVGSITEVLSAQNSYLSEPKDFKNNLLYIYNNYHEAKNKSYILKKHLEENFSIKKFINEHENIYKECVSLS